MSGLALRSTPLGERAPQLLAWGAAIVAALACLWLMVQLLWVLLTPVGVDAATDTMVQRVVPVAAPVTNVARWHLFGNGQRNRIAVDIASAGTRTALKLVLHGTVSDSGGRSGYALIADEHGVEHSYQVGDRIVDGVTLAAVYADRVALDNRGHRETLDLPRETLHRAPPAAARRQPDSVPGKASAPIYVAPNLSTGGVDWKQAQQTLRDDPARALQQFDVQPVLDGARLRGVRLGGGASNPLAAAAGLQDDDVVTAINGVPLDSLSRGQELMDKLRDARHVTLTVERDGKARTLEVDVPATP